MTSVRQRRIPAEPSVVINSQAKDARNVAEIQEVEPYFRHLRSTPLNSSALVFGVILFYVFIVGVVHYYHNWLPSPLPLDAPSNVFSEARSRVILEKIQSFGYRPVGTRANEVLVPEYLKSQIKSIEDNAIAKVEVDVQQPAGAFGLDFLTQFQNVYANISNIVVRVSDRNAGPEVLQNALLLSSHYDAAIGGAAASDDGVNIAIMMELLRYYALYPPKHATLIFNFNGAEETLLQAAHGFITQHPWATTIKAFINLEAAGAGGRELLFQTGSDELALAYTEGAKYPFASIIAQELFQSGVIPADTDFRVYRDFGAIAGMDFAYISNGYVYHTMIDDITRIQPGAIQRFGDNLVGIIAQLTSVPGRLNKVATNHTSTTVFFDVMGLIMVTMSKSRAYLLCSIVVIAAFVYLYQSSISVAKRVELMYFLGRCHGTGMAWALAYSIVLTLFAPLSWYSAPYLAGLIYLLPTLAGMLSSLVSYIAKHQDKSPQALWTIEKALFEAILTYWLVLLVVVMYIGANSAYVLAFWVGFPLIGQMVCYALKRVHLLTTLRYIVISLGAVMIPMLHSGFIFAMGYTFLIPLMGRSGPQLPPDVVVAILFIISASVMVSFSGRFFCLLPVKHLLILRNVLVSISLIILIFSSMRNPYSNDCPKRLIVQHVSRETVLPNGTTKQHDAGLWVNALDFRGLSTIKPYLATTPWNETLLVAPPPSLVETLDIYGEMPFSIPSRHILPERFSWYLASQPPSFTSQDYKTNLHVVSSRYNPDTNRRIIHLHLTGPSHMNIFIDATKTRLTSWSLGKGVDVPVPSNDGDVYILLFAEAYPPASFHFWIEAESNTTIEMVAAGHHLEKVTSEMVIMRSVLPSWIDTMQAVSTWSSHSI